MSLLTSGSEAEILHEQNCLNMGLAQYRARTADLEQRKDASKTDYGKHLLNHAMDPFIAAIETFVREAQEKPGPKHESVKWLTTTYVPKDKTKPVPVVPVDVAALIASRLIIGGVAVGSSYASTANNIGNRIEDEFRFQAFEAQNDKLWYVINRRLDGEPDGHKPDYRRTVLVYSMNKFGVGFTKSDKTSKFHIGSKLIELFVASTGLVSLSARKTGKGKRTYDPTSIIATPELMSWIAEFRSRSELLAPFWMPMICPPRPWTSITEGGYHHPQLQLRLVKPHTQSFIKELQQREMPNVYEAVNRLQDTAWRINKRLLDAATAVEEAGIAVKGFPSRFEIPREAKPEWSEETKDVWAAWKNREARNFKEGKRNAKIRLQTGIVLWTARTMKDYPGIWFPYTLDFRGRMYCVPSHLNPQGRDLSKGLLEFAEGRALGTDGAWWLGVHVANTFGQDKIPLEDRFEWANDNADWIVECAKDPLTNRRWTEADKPFQFLAAAMDWQGYVEQGEDYVSHIPVMVDGSCNGIQNFAAMLRDEVAGAQVNLVPQEKPSDIYAEVARITEEKLRQSCSDFGTGWLAYGVTRSLCKRPVMVLPYGGTKEAVRKYIIEFCEEQSRDEKKPIPMPFGKDFGKAASWLREVVWETMKEVVKGPRVAMDWLKQVATAVSSAHLPVCWSTPSGFLVQQAYCWMVSKQIQTRTKDGLRRKFRLTEASSRLDVKKQAQAIAPNFVHSLDAAALVLTIVRAAKNGVSQFAAVHDSYGTLAADMPELRRSLREAFVEMYEQNDVLKQFLDEVSGVPEMEGKTFPPMPERGALDLSGVLRSDFFFA